VKTHFFSSADRVKSPRHLLTENLSYKVVSLFVALFLWVTILGRRDFVGLKEFEIQLSLPPGMMLVSQSADIVRIKVSGAQPIVKRFKEKTSVLRLDVTDYQPGTFEIDLQANQFDLPQGIRMLSIKPNTLKIALKLRKDEPRDGAEDTK
jgi:YbbR domain-containing protein